MAQRLCAVLPLPYVYQLWRQHAHRSAWTDAAVVGVWLLCGLIVVGLRWRRVSLSARIRWNDAAFGRWWRRFKHGVHGRAAVGGATGRAAAAPIVTMVVDMIVTTLAVHCAVAPGQRGGIGVRHALKGAARGV